MSGHVVPLPVACLWCGAPALAETTCPMSIPCPHCQAGPGKRCRLPNWHASPKLHEARWRAAAELDKETRDA